MGEHHDPATRATAMAALLAGQSLTKVAEEYSIPKSTIARWKAEAATEHLPRPEVGTLILEYLQENLITLRVQAEHFRDKAWLKKQPADALAVLHGVMTDKAIRLLEAMSKASANAAERDAPNY